MLPVHKVCYSKLIKTSLLGFVTSSKGLLQEENEEPKVRTSDGFDLNAYKLIEKSSYNFSKPPSVGHVIEAKPYGLNDKQEMIQR